MIQIDMKMPKCCDDCDVCYDGYYCPIARIPLNFETSEMQRMLNCPLKEVPDTNFGKWISVKERLPEVGKVVLAFGTRSATTGQFQGINNKNDLWWWKGRTIKRVTHWMPLPEPPKEG